MIAFVPLSTVAADAVEALLDRAFGVDRHARTAYKVRGDGNPIARLSVAAIERGALVATIQCWPVTLSTDDGEALPLVMIGPVAVEPARQRDGIGRLLMTHALHAAHRDALDQAMMLIGDPDYYGRFFGFDSSRTGGWRLPGPIERHRLLAKGNAVPAVAGTLGPARAPLAARFAAGD
ncbi:GNAT family N-acetyltransferase [Sphingomonas oligophenolica]|uniref:N-acetyltransferase n=1 Tax=Sphingomonas oligophenolica TaxID=301154 RepID=A0A502CN39_9SPHN|nr:N-acetyltransferase [Sphingomonas oligophenolica]